jgi:hypothetical protein
LELELSTSEYVDKLLDDKTEISKVAEKAMAQVDLAMIEKEATAVADLFKDGFQASDIFKAVSHLMEIAEVMEGTTGAEKKEFVVAAFKLAYEKMDPDISSWIPQWLEQKAVVYAIENVLPHAIDWIVDASKGKLGINKE